MDYTSTEFDIRKIDNYTLLIQAGVSEQHLSVVDETGSLVLLTVFNIHQLHSQARDILHAPFSQVRIACPQHAYTFVPDEVYDEQYVNNYASFVLDGGTKKQMSVSHISSIGVRNVYAVEPLGYYALTRLFPHAKVVPDSSAILEVAGRKLIKKQGTYLGVDVHGSRLAIYCFDKGQFLFFNTFDVADENDFNYHLLNVVHGLGLSWDSLRCMLSGQIAEQDSHYKVINKYTDQVEFADTSRMARVGFPVSLEEYQHRYLMLMGLLTCEL